MADQDQAPGVRLPLEVAPDRNRGLGLDGYLGVERAGEPGEVVEDGVVVVPREVRERVIGRRRLGVRRIEVVAQETPQDFVGRGCDLGAQEERQRLASGSAWHSCNSSIRTASRRVKPWRNGN